MGRGPDPQSPYKPTANCPAPQPTPTNPKRSEAPPPPTASPPPTAPPPPTHPDRAPGIPQGLGARPRPPLARHGLRLKPRGGGGGGVPRSRRGAGAAGLGLDAVRLPGWGLGGGEGALCRAWYAGLRRSRAFWGRGRFAGWARRRGRRGVGSSWPVLARPRCNTQALGRSPFLTRAPGGPPCPPDRAAPQPPAASWPPEAFTRSNATARSLNGA